MTFDRESAVMRKRITPWLVFLLAILLPTVFSVGYAAESYRSEKQRAGEGLELERLEVAKQTMRELESSVTRAKAVVHSIPFGANVTFDEASRIVIAGKPAYADLLTIPVGSDAHPLDGTAPGVRSGWLHRTYSPEGLARFWLSDGDDIVMVRQLGTGERVGYVFTADRVERAINEQLSRRGFAAVRTVKKPVTPEELRAHRTDRDPDAVGFVMPGQVALNPRAVWDVVLEEPGRFHALELRHARRMLQMRLAATGIFVVIAFVLFVRGQRQKRLADLRTDYVAAVSHELRTPLASVRMFAELLEAEAVPPGERREVELSLANEARRLHATLERMLRFGSLSRGKLAAERAPTPLRPLLDAAAARGGVRVAVEVDTALEASVDAGLLGHALDNLVGNANKYAPEGPVLLRAGQEGEDIVIDVVDHGPGLDRKARRRIWQPFERADDRLSKATQGTGVGLALVDGIARAHGGKATVTSTPGAGATFRVRFPRKG